ncbi:MAG TPA: ribosomal-protein-alanine N-acetyltransferase [Alphaproteobacteria bacterium]|nr:ribosomal-protein-alanine N-acetyltransferase [Alphaproteobacteria bacterium]
MNFDNQLLDIYNDCFPEREAEPELEFLVKNSSLLKLQENGLTICFLFYKTIYEDEVEILDFGTMKNFRNKGYGKKILSILFEKLRGENIKKIFLEVAESNHAAIMLYKNQGFVESGKRRNYYNSGSKLENALILCKNL